jgi:hypothetical protein
MANILELAKKMGISAAPDGVKNKTTHSAKRRPWLEDEKGQDTEVRRGELKNPESLAVKAEKLEKSAKKWGKVEEKTSNLIKKSDARIKRRAESTTDHLQVAHISTTDRQRTRRDPSFLEFQCLKGVTRAVAFHVRDKATKSFDGEYFSIINTDELKEITGKSAKHISTTILRLEEQGWFSLENSSNAGMRAIKISNPLIFGIR